METMYFIEAREHGKPHTHQVVSGVSNLLVATCELAKKDLTFDVFEIGDHIMSHREMDKVEKAEVPKEDDEWKQRDLSN